MASTTPEFSEADAHPQELTNFIRTVVYGMAVQAASGATRNDLERVIQVTMRGWPQDAA